MEQLNKRTKKQNLLNKEDTEELLDYLKQHGNQRRFAEEIKISTTMINIWKRNQKFPYLLKFWLDLKKLKDKIKKQVND